MFESDGVLPYSVALIGLGLLLCFNLLQHTAVLLLMIVHPYCMIFDGTLAAIHLRVLEATHI